MNFHSAEDFLLTNNQAKFTTILQNSLRDSAELPSIVADGAKRGLRIFPIYQTSKYATSSLIKARIGDATNDVVRLEEFAAENPAGWAFATRPDAGVFATEMEEEYGIDAFNGLIALAIISLQGDESDWQTLSARAGRSIFAIYNYPAGMRMLRSRKHPEPGLTIHGEEGGYVLLRPDFIFLDRDISIASGPQLLVDLASKKIPNEVLSKFAQRIALQRLQSSFLPNKAKPGTGSEIWGIAGKEFQERSNVGWRGKFRISRRR